ncbi:MAG: zinc ABC transporter substrate-binding protein, partial [Alphaproteobacteria bacterium]|nr:zinc ABC transporter substrate-binding protein [Alphaproteobacteria bacterium]
MRPQVWKLFFIFFIIFLSPNLVFSQSIPQGIKVVTTIKPIHSIISSLTQNISIPEFIVDGYMSEHGYILRPTDIQKLSDANMVVWVGETVDPFIVSYIKHAPKNQLIINLHKIPGINLLKIRSGGVWEALEHHDDCTENIHEDDHDEENHPEEHVHDHNCSDTTEI